MDGDTGMTITDHGTWVSIYAAAGMDLINADGFRTKSVACPTAQQSNWSEVAELVADVFDESIMTAQDKLFLQSLRYNFAAIAEYVNDLYSSGKISLDLYNKIKTRMTNRKNAIDYYTRNKATMTKAQLTTCIESIIG